MRDYMSDGVFDSARMLILPVPLIRGKLWGALLFSSRTSVRVASLSSSRVAAEAAFSSARRTTLVGSMTPASTKSTYFLSAAS